jgi:hypothetical protein
MGMQYEDRAAGAARYAGNATRHFEDRIMDSPEPSPDAVGYVSDKGMVSEWVEVWDYVGGIRFLGFVAEKEGERTLFVFFDQDVIGGKIKAG